MYNTFSVFDVEATDVDITFQEENVLCSYLYCYLR